MTEPVLTPQDRQSSPWLKVKQHLEARLAKLRAENDGDLPIEKTAKLRGRIAEVKALMALDADPAPLNDENDRFRD